MKTISVRILLREPLKVKRMTRTGQPVQVTEHGKPLWVIQSAVTEEGQDRRKRDIDKLLDQVLNGPRAKAGLAKMVLESRR